MIMVDHRPVHSLANDWEIFMPPKSFKINWLVVNIYARIFDFDFSNPKFLGVRIDQFTFSQQADF